MTCVKKVSICNTGRVEYTQHGYTESWGWLEKMNNDIKSSSLLVTCHYNTQQHQDNMRLLPLLTVSQNNLTIAILNNILGSILGSTISDILSSILSSEAEAAWQVEHQAGALPDQPCPGSRSSCLSWWIWSWSSSRGQEMKIFDIWLCLHYHFLLPEE